MMNCMILQSRCSSAFNQQLTLNLRNFPALPVVLSYRCRCHYEVLEVKESASQKEIRDAYIRLSKKYHPDAQKGRKETESLFKEVTNAYDILGKAASRRDYDSQRKTGPVFGDGPRAEHEQFHQRHQHTASGARMRGPDYQFEDHNDSRFFRGYTYYRQFPRGEFMHDEYVREEEYIRQNYDPKNNRKGRLSHGLECLLIFLGLLTAGHAVAFLLWKKRYVDFRPRQTNSLVQPTRARREEDSFSAQILKQYEEPLKSLKKKAKHLEEISISEMDKATPSREIVQELQD